MESIEKPIATSNVLKLNSDRAARLSLGLNSRLLIQAAVVFLVSFVILAVVQFSFPDLAGNDGYYHIKFAEQMRLEGITPRFASLPLTILAPDEFYDHHFLFHVAMIPFTFGDLITGAKLATVLFASLAFTATWVLFASQKVPGAVLWALGLLVVSDAFLYRMSMPRAQTLSLALLAISLFLLLSGRYRWLILLGFVYVWLYNAFPLLLVLAAITSGAIFLLERRIELRPVVYAGLGIAVGLVLNPYFPENLAFIYQHLAPKLVDATSVGVGNEWYPYETATLLKNSLPALVALAVGFLAVGLRGEKIRLRTLVLLLATIVFSYMVFQSRRWVEYFPAFCLMFCAFAVSDWLQSNDPLRTVEVAKLASLASRRSLYNITLAGVGVVCLVAAGVYTLPRTVNSLQDSKPHTLYQDSASFLKSTVPPGELVYTVDWDDFPRLYHYHPGGAYLQGLDPTYLQSADSTLFILWDKISRGEIFEPSRIIRESFGASYVFSDVNQDAFLTEAEADPGLVEIYRDREAVVYHVLP
jgi:hypothetical protein